jgi:hypothetical protein
MIGDRELSADSGQEGKKLSAVSWKQESKAWQLVRAEN